MPETAKGFWGLHQHNMMIARTWWRLLQNQKHGWPIKLEIRLGIFDWLYGKSIVMKLLLKIPTKIDINYYGKMVPWLSLKLSQSRSGAEFSIGQKPTQLAENICFWAGTIFPPCGPVAPKQWCAVVAVISLDARERLSAESLSLMSLNKVVRTPQIWLYGCTYNTTVQ